jgi:MOSC domain-containing protein YiiM
MEAPLPAAAERDDAGTRGVVVALHLGIAVRAPLRPVERVRAGLRRGLEGDRHDRPGHRRAVLVMEQEVLAALGLAPGTVREQVTVRGIDLHGLPAGTRLRVGSAVLELAGHCAPCARMDEIRPGLRGILEGRRGRFVHVAQEGAFGVNDPIEVEPQPRS